MIEPETMARLQEIGTIAGWIFITLWALAFLYSISGFVPIFVKRHKERKFYMPKLRAFGRVARQWGEASEDVVKCYLLVKTDAPTELIEEYYQKEFKGREGKR